MPHRLSATELEDIARLSYKLGQYDSALATINDAINLRPSPEPSLLDLRAATYEKLDNDDAALADTKTLVRNDPTNPAGYLRAGRIMCRLAKYKNAVAVYERGLAKIPQEHQDRSRLREKLKQASAMLSPERFSDPLPQLPLEVVEMILSYLTFKDQCRCSGVSKSWQTLLSSLPSLWLNLDLSGATKPIPSSLISKCINRSRHQLHTATLSRVVKLESSLIALTDQCRSLATLTIYHRDPKMESLTSCFTRAASLRSLSLDGFVVKQPDILNILRRCPQLRSLHCASVDDAKHMNPDWEGISPRLESLHLITQITLSRIAVGSILEHAVGLRSLKLRGWGMSHDERNLSFAKQTKLEELDLRAGTVTVSDLPPTLTTLRLHSHASPPPRSAAPLPFSLPALQHLTCVTMQDVEMLLDRQVDGWSADGAPLVSLAIPSSELTVEWESSVLTADRLKFLYMLALPGARRVDQELIPLVSRQMPTLQLLDVSRSDISGVGVKMLVENLTELKVLRLNYCNDLSYDAVEWARSRGVEVECHLDERRKTGKSVRYGT